MGGRKCNIPLLTEQKTRRVNGGKTVKKLIALLLAMILSVSMFSGCSSKEENGEQQQTAEQTTSTEGNMVSADCKGSVLTWNLGVDSQTLDPAKAVSDDSMSVINNTFEGLMREDAEEIKEEGLPWEGTGCWSPIFPARHSDVSRAASLVVDCIDRITERRKAKANYAYVTKRDEDGFLLGIDRMEL